MEKREGFMRSRLALVFAVGSALISGFPAMAVAGDDPAGSWRDNEKGSIIKVYECGGGMCAQVIKPYEPQAKDINNPNPALRDRAIAGLTIMNGAKKSGGNVWKGMLYNAEDGKSYSGSMTLVSDSVLEMRGCAFSIFCQTRGFTRVK
jgi:uncharacterized protein (DUF2147 family)